ncbi:hypothetical protein [Halovenus sp. HT40]|uniref:hypothetical protein n=1 Tax=Halovenus sp. HT40 TaxID=3126691 RepID=UPI00300F7179
MTARNPPDTATSGTATRRWTVRATVRVPRGGGADLASDASRRLESPPHVDSVEVDDIRGLEPALAATAVGLELTVVMNQTAPVETVRAELNTAPGTERVEQVTPAER